MTRENIDPLVPSRARHFLALIIDHGHIAPLVIRPSQIDDLRLIVPFLPQEAIDLVVQVPDRIVG